MMLLFEGGVSLCDVFLPDEQQTLIETAKRKAPSIEQTPGQVFLSLSLAVSHLSKNDSVKESADAVVG